MHHADYAVVLVCDFTEALTHRVLDVYRFFRATPQIVLVRRGRMKTPASYPFVKCQSLPLRVVGHERGVRLVAILSAAVYVASSAFLFARLMTQPKRIRLVHSHFIFPQGLLGLVLSRLLRVPLVVTAVGQDVNELMRDSYLLRIASLFVLRNACTVVAVSRPLQRRLHELGVESKYIPNSVDTESIYPLRGIRKPGIVLFVGSMTKRKRPLLLLEAYEKIASRVPRTRLVMVGDGPLKGMIQEEILEKGLKGRATVTSDVDERALNDLRQQASIFVLPSASEGISLALLEAMASGMTVIASRNESHSEILQHGKDALLFDLDNSGDLATEMLRAIRSPRLMSRLGKSARGLCESQFSNSGAARLLEDTYDQLSVTRSRKNEMRTR